MPIVANIEIQQRLNIIFECESILCVTLQSKWMGVCVTLENGGIVLFGGHTGASMLVQVAWNE